MQGKGHYVKQKMQSRLNVVLGLLTISAIGLSAFGFADRLSERVSGLEAIDKLEIGVRCVKDMINVDSDREKSIAKVITIVSRYNKTMTDDLKYAIAEEIYTMSKVYPNLDLDLICATITHESALTWEPTVVSHAGAMGLMQIMPTTGTFLAAIQGVEWTSPEEILFDPVLNIRLGCQYLSSLIDMFDVEGGLAAYNGGASRAARWIANNRDYTFLVEETRYYIPAIKKLYYRFKGQEHVM